MKLVVCRKCQQHYQNIGSEMCPHCNHSSATVSIVRSSLPAVTILLGLGLMACDDRKEDTAIQKDSGQTEEPSAEPTSEALYGVPNTDL